MAISDNTVRRAEQRMRLAATPRAIAARHDRRMSRAVVTLSNGPELALPPHLAEGLADAKPADLRQIGHDLDVRYILEGSVRRMGDRVEVNAQLVDAENGAHVWADRFETDRRNLAEAQSEITGRLAHTLDRQLIEADGRWLELKKDADPGASDLAM